MRKLILVRHAKSSWQNLEQSDFDRPLNDRGKKNAPVMAKRLHDREPDINAFVSSPARRAFSTAIYFADVYQIKQAGIHQIPELYHASPSTFSQVVAELNNDWKTVALFSHNPGITDFINSLTTVRIDNMPTCGVFAISAKIDSWQEFADAEKHFDFFDYPKLDL